MASMSEYVCNSLVLTTTYTEMTFRKENPPAIQLHISIADLTQMVQGGIFGTENPASCALLRNLESFTTYIAYSKEHYKLEVEKRQEEERLCRKEQAARQYELQLLWLAEGCIHELEREIAHLRMRTGDSNMVHGNPRSLRTPNGWEDNTNGYPYARS
jgi:hypothetical protein